MSWTVVPTFGSDDCAAALRPVAATIAMIVRFIADLLQQALATARAATAAVLALDHLLLRGMIRRKADGRQPKPSAIIGHPMRLSVAFAGGLVLMAVPAVPQPQATGVMTREFIYE